MPLFPIFLDLRGKKVLIVGGGHVALRKAERLAPYGASITAVAPEFAPGFAALGGVTALERRFQPGDVEGAALVIAATDDAELNAAVSELCAWEGIPVNVVDDLALCSFVFPALVRRGELSVGISTGGASPSAAQYIRRLVEEQVPDGFEEILDFLAARRAQLKSALPAERRSAAYAALFSRCMELGRALTDGEFAGFMEEI